jgi:caa(3)-type oxidase subunit IV
MTQSTQTPEHEGEEAHSHPSPGDYVMIAVILAVLTALEVGLYWAGEAGTPPVATVPALVFLTVLKFALVAMWFMHLRFDRRVFSRLFVGGLILALIIYAVVLAMTVL